MTTRLDLTLPTRDLTVGHWRFNSDLSDDSTYANHLSGNVEDGDFRLGYAEDGNSVLHFPGADLGGDDPGVMLAAAEALDFDFGTSDFSVELLLCTGFTGIASLINKLAGSTGWQIGFSSGQLLIQMTDGIENQSELMSLPILNDARPHYLALVFDRGTGLVHAYLDGTESPESPWDFSLVTGSISSATANLRIGLNLEADVDEICITRELLTPAAIAERARGQLVQDSSFADGFLEQYLPGADQDSEDLAQFLRPMNTTLRELIETGYGLPLLTDWTRCPVRYLPLLASTLGLDLIGSEYATERERRSLVEWAGWLFQRRGKAEAIQKFAELLGFSCAVAETTPDSVPFVLNFNRTWDIDLLTTQLIEESFDNLHEWLPAEYPDTHWRIASGRLYDTGPGYLLTENDWSTYRLQVTYEITDIPHTGLSGHSFGCYLKWAAADDWLRVVMSFSATWGNQLLLEWQTPGGSGNLVLYSFSGWDIEDFGTGEHLFWCFVDSETGTITGGIDSHGLFFDQSLPSGQLNGKKGLLGIDYDFTIAFDNWELRTFDSRLAATLFSSSHSNRSLTATLSGTPQFELAKRAYLAEVLKQYVPMGVDLIIA